MATKQKAKVARIVPAILTADPVELRAMVRQAEGFVSYVQFDIMDGQFVPSHSVSPEDVAAVGTRLSWEAHLMVLHPWDYLESLKKAGAEKIVFHYEADPSPRDTIEQARRLSLKVGLAINPETPVSAIFSLVPEVDSVLFLTVHPGYYGRKFLPEVLDKVVELKHRYPRFETGVDGGVTEHNIMPVARLGVDYVCVGHAIFHSPDPAESFHRLMALAEGAGRQKS
jgi:ribulose-phosphate 3-epimerase